ncbi:putative cell survival pathways protein [Podochytrium sp. JEL0797]|nr:putative cell survival pathways protein [Podochytrium sp. JEL0797]
MSWFATAPTVFPPHPVVRVQDPALSDIELSKDVPVTDLTCSSDEITWKLEYAAAATECFTYYLTLDNGTYVLAQMVYSTIGLAPSVQMTLRIYNSDKTKFNQTVSPYTTSFLVSEDKQSVECDQFSIKFNNGKYVLKFDLGEAAIDVQFDPIDGFFKVNDGKSMFGETEYDGYVEAQFAPKASVSGTLTFGGKKVEAKGQGLFVKAIQCYPQGIAKWNFFNLQNAQDSIMAYEYDMPQASGGACVSIGSIVRNGKLIAVTTSNRVVHVQKQLDEEFSGYEVPTQLFLTLNGKTKDSGEDVHVEISFVQSNLCDKIDVLSELPFLLRKLIQTFITAPFLFQWYDDVVANVTVGADSFKIEGKGFMECSFLMNEY